MAAEKESRINIVTPIETEATRGLHTSIEGAEKDPMAASGGWQQLRDEKKVARTGAEDRASADDVTIELGETRRPGSNGAGDQHPPLTEYKVYKRRWFGLVQLTLLNIIVSWDVSSF